MKFHTPIRLEDAAQLLNCRFAGDPDHLVTGMNEIHRVEAGDLCFVDYHKYYDKALGSAATTILIDQEVACPSGKGLLISDDPFRDFNKVAMHFQPQRPLDTAQSYNLETDFPQVKAIGKNVVMGENVTLGADVEIGHNAVIGSDVVIGEGTKIHANVTIYDHTLIGKHCTVNSGAVLGSEAFYYKKRDYGRDKMLSVGRVILGDHVDIGAGCTIDRGVSHNTVIGDWTKLDNLVQVGHDTVIGKRCVIAAQVGIAGVVQIEDDVNIWGQVGVVQDLTIGQGATLMGKTGVMSSLEGGKAYGGMVADDARNFLRKEAALKRLIEIMPELEGLLKREA
ncbi:MAG: UDP-3-O-(3-hydroxymyristoyl)glucosamine N-acyltransferase [Bacteroidota bacterium]